MDGKIEITPLINPDNFRHYKQEIKRAMKNPNKVKLAVLSAGLAAVLIGLPVGSSFATTPAVFQDGAAIYAAKCAKCHNADGTGNAKYKKQGIEDMADANWQKNHSDAKIAAAINNGK